MDLLLWRHAEAEDINPADSGNDMARRLTEKGQRQAKLMADWLDRHAPSPLQILVSPAVRTQQTAEALKLSPTRIRHISRDIAPGANVDALLKAAGWNSAASERKNAVLLVGHQPVLGAVVARLLTGHNDSWAVKKGALWWLRQRERFGEQETILIASLSPEHLT